jgi:hypothetical protein
MKTTLAILAAACALAACSDADVASSNLSKAADNFEINRRVVFYNGITGDYMLSIEGLCSKGNNDAARQLSITCTVGPGTRRPPTPRRRPRRDPPGRQRTASTFRAALHRSPDHPSGIIDETLGTRTALHA